MSLAQQYYLSFAAAFVRGKRLQGEPVEMREELCDKALDELTPAELEEVFECGRRAGLKLHKFKRTGGLARVRRVLSALRGLQPSELLDIGSGRGVFLWPLLDAFPGLPVTAIDVDERRANDLEAVKQGGVSLLSAYQMDAARLDFDAEQFDIVSFLETLEHIPCAQQALDEAMRVARRFVVISVPSKPDDNPEHIHLFDQKTLANMLKAAGASNASFDYVIGHIIAVAVK